jgi:hypothetical protein
MLHSPGTKRRCVAAIPEEVLLKLSLLGVRLIWCQHLDAWQITRVADGFTWSQMIEDAEPDWDYFLSYIADHVCRQKTPPAWTNTQHVDTMPIEAAAVINEEAFRDG